MDTKELVKKIKDGKLGEASGVFETLMDNLKLEVVEQVKKEV